MKYLNQLIVLVILASILLSGCALYGSKVDESERFIEKIIYVEGKSKNEIYINANAWFVDNFNSAESVIDFQDKESGTIIGKYNFEIRADLTTFNVKSTLKLDIKDGKVRVRLYNPRSAVVGYVIGRHNKSVVYSSDITTPVMDRIVIRWSELLNGLEGKLRKTSNW